MENFEVISHTELRKALVMTKNSTPMQTFVKKVEDTSKA